MGGKSITFLIGPQSVSYLCLMIVCLYAPNYGESFCLYMIRRESQ